MKTIEIPSKLLVVWEHDMIGDRIGLKLKHEVAEWLMDQEIEYTPTLPTVMGPLDVTPKIHIFDDREAMIFKLTWF